jgi:hypothetical protein
MGSLHRGRTKIISLPISPKFRERNFVGNPNQGPVANNGYWPRALKRAGGAPSLRTGNGGPRKEGGKCALLTPKKWPQSNSKAVGEAIAYGT